ncbi:MAG: alpha/beta fold hydrolase [Proteobacteria bacterium]|nr:alpha/beta fold hydrolase [Pseudomonadota bacterium]
MPEPGSVLVVHGLWMTGLEATLFRHRLAHAGYHVRQFHYRSMTAVADEVLEELDRAVTALPPPVQLVGHSLGGLLVLRYLGARPERGIGRAVLLGSPVNGSRSARAFARLPGMSIFFGPLAGAELLAESAPAWRGAARIGVIAGSHGIGFGRLLAALPEPHDGTVAVDETRLEGAADHLVLPVTHTGLLFSDEVCEATLSFLRSGRFAPRPP